MLKKVLVVALLGLSSTAFAGGFQIKVGASLIDPTADTTLAPPPSDSALPQRLHLVLR